MDYHGGGGGTDGDVGGEGGGSGGHFFVLRCKNVHGAPRGFKVPETTSSWPQQTRGYWQDF